MNKPKLFGFDDERTNKAPRITGIRPVSSQIFVEILTAQEALGTDLHLGDAADVGAPQAYVLDIGPGLKSEDYGFKKGDRVLLQGTYIPAPKYDDCKRRRGLVEVHNIKAVIEETK